MDWGSFMFPPPPVDPPSYDLNLVALPILDPPEHVARKSTRRLAFWHRLAAAWCRCHGDDHSKHIRTNLERLIAQIRKRRQTHGK